MCVFSKWVEVVALTRHDAETVWQVFFEMIICRYGVPLGVQVDQGNEFKVLLLQGWKLGESMYTESR